MKRKKLQYTVITGGIMMLVLLVSGCDLINPTEVRNPQTTEESLREGGTGATVPFLNGVMEEFAAATEGVTYFTDVVSDNFDNVATYISPLCDLPREMRPDDLTLNQTDDIYFDVQQLRAIADFVLEGVIPNDVEATDEQKAEVLFYRGMANLLSAENFAAVPVEEGGPAIAQDALLDLAAADFNAALETSQHADFAARIHLVKARVYRLMGDAVNAAAEANAALAAGSPDFTFTANYDAETHINAAYQFAVSRNLNDVQPLPRLDFLDPKYIDRDTPINAVKMEEAHLILAEASLSNGDNAGAVTHLVDAIELAKSRLVQTWADSDPRLTRPSGGTVQADADAPAVAGLIFPRNGTSVDVPMVSGTSLDAAQVGLLTDPAEIFYTIYLARQEIFFYEGRRMCDLGIRLPMMKREIETNDAISEGGTGTQVQVPAYIPAGDDMDDFTIDGENTIIAYDMNRILTENRVSPFTMPF